MRATPLASGPQPPASSTEPPPRKRRKRAPKPRGRTGPTTPAGKARSSKNAARHWMIANDSIIPDFESEEEWTQHVAGFMDDFQPEGYVETFYVKLLAKHFWRLLRVGRNETFSIHQSILGVPGHMLLAENMYADKSKGLLEPDEDEVIARMHNTVMPSHSETDRTIRYEAHVQRQIVHTLRQLLLLQARRRGDALYMPRYGLTTSADMRDPQGAGVRKIKPSDILADAGPPAATAS